MDTIATLPNGDPNYCLMCGHCCWDWRGGGGASSKCEYLDDDLRTCLIYAELPERFQSCLQFPVDRSIIVDLHEECGFYQQWIKE